MTTALSIFKKANIDLSGIGNYLSQGLQGTGSNAQNYLVKGLGGAALGGLGMGAASYLGGDSEDPHRGRNSIMSGLQGALLGGGLGAGAQAAQDQWFKGSPPPAPVQKLQDQAQQHGATIDPEPLGKNHPFWQAGVNATHGGPMNGAIVGGAAGAGYHGREEYNASKLFRDMKAKVPTPTEGNPADRGAALANANTGSGQWQKERMLRKIIQDSGGSLNLSDTNKLVEQMGLGGPHQTDSLSRKMFNENIAPLQGTYANDRQGVINRLLSKAQIKGHSAGDVHAWADNNLHNFVGKSPKALDALRTAGGYGKSVGVGALAGMGAQYGGRAIVDGLMRANYPKEQIQAWNSYQ